MFLCFSCLLSLSSCLFLCLLLCFCLESQVWSSPPSLSFFASRPSRWCNFCAARLYLTPPHPAFDHISRHSTILLLFFCISQGFLLCFQRTWVWVISNPKIYVVDFGNFKQSFWAWNLFKKSKFRNQGMLFQHCIDKNQNKTHFDLFGPFLT